MGARNQSPVLKRFAEYAAGLAKEALPEDALHAAKRCLIDWFASAIRGGLQPPATQVRTVRSVTAACERHGASRR